jgi:hypothetical protein
MSAGYCPLDINSGIIELVGPINQSDLKTIENRGSPFSISFAPRTTIPTLIGNRIEETSENTITLKGDRYSLVDVQICSPLHKGYILPFMNETPTAELVLSFSAKSIPSSLQQLSGILLCIPIYDSGFPNHNQYISQLINNDAPQCNYTNITGSDYIGGDYQNIQNTSLLQCINQCCNDPKCMAYTHNSGTCYLKNSIPKIVKTGNNKTITGTVNHTQPGAQCSSQKDKESKVANLQTIFYDWENDESQISLTYRTCFETFDINNNPSSRSLFIAVFPYGIHLSQQDFQILLLQLGGTLQSFQCPPALRNAENTLKSYTFDSTGLKIPQNISSDGLLYRTPVSTVSDDFKERFEYFLKPPKLSNKFDSNSCPYYKTEQYKCVPFDQFKDLSGNYVIPGNTTLQNIIQKQNINQTSEINSSSTSLSSKQIEESIGIIIGAGSALLAFIAIGSWLSKSHSG